MAKIVIIYDDNGNFNAHVEGALGAQCEGIDLDALLGGTTLEEGWTPEHDAQQRRTIRSQQKQKARR